MTRDPRCFFCGGQIGSPVYLEDDDQACLTCTIDAAKTVRRIMKAAQQWAERVVTLGKADEGSSAG